MDFADIRKNWKYLHKIVFGNNSVWKELKDYDYYENY